jgi:hypothetical protein
MKDEYLSAAMNGLVGTFMPAAAVVVQVVQEEGVQVGGLDAEGLKCGVVIVGLNMWGCEVGLVHSYGGCGEMTECTNLSTSPSTCSYPKAIHLGRCLYWVMSQQEMWGEMVKLLKWLKELSIAFLHVFLCI